MTLLVVLVSLLVERTWRSLQQWRDYQWFEAYTDWITGLLGKSRLSGWPAVAAVLLPPVLVTAWLAGLFDDALFGLLELAFGVVVLLYTLGPRDLDGELEEYVEAVELGDAIRQRSSARPLLSEEPSPEWPGQINQVARAVFHEADTRVFAVLFWFVLLGPAGAVLYRLAQQLDEARSPVADAEPQFVDAAGVVHGLLAWMPARLLAATFALVGNFEAVGAAWKRATRETIDLSDGNRRLVMDSGSAAMGLPEVEWVEGDPAPLREARSLLFRSLIVWVVAVALLVLVGLR